MIYAVYFSNDDEVVVYGPKAKRKTCINSSRTWKMKPFPKSLEFISMTKTCSSGIRSFLVPQSLYWYFVQNFPKSSGLDKNILKAIENEAEKQLGISIEWEDMV